MQTGPLFLKFRETDKKIIICQGGGDAGKCLGIDTPVLMYDLTIKMVQDIQEGELLMGIDGTPRTVLSTTKGVGQLYKVKQKRGIDYVCNDAHILCLKHSEGKEIYKTIKGKKVYQGRVKYPGIHKMTAEDYFNSSKRIQRQYRGFKAQAIELPHREVLLPAYYLGLWLGDGIKSTSNICRQSKTDKNTIVMSRPKGPKFNGKRNLLINGLTKYGILYDKKIPKEYLLNSIEVRKQLLAGLVDSDGTLAKQGYYSISTINHDFADQIVLLASSLGYFARKSFKVSKMKRKDGSTYCVDSWSITISCNNGESIPCLIKRKQKVFANKVCDCLNSSIEIEKLEVGDYYGFTLDGDRMFLLGDFTVTHNTSDILKSIVLDECIKIPKTRVTITGEDLPNLKRGVVRILKDYILCDPEVKPYVKKSVKDDTYITFTNESFIEVTGFDNEQDARGSERDILFMNECNSRSYNLFWQLYRKTRRRVFLDYNPTQKFWVQSKIMSGKEKMFVGKWIRYITDHRHNPFLSQEDHDSYEMISDPELFLVYSRGQLGKTKGQIYNNFKKVDKIPEGLEFGFGIDIGYTSDKTAIVKVYYKGRDRYYQVLLYKSEIEILEEIQQKNLDITVYQYIAKILKANGCTTSTLVWGDHDNSYSNSLRKLGIGYRNARKPNNAKVKRISKVKACNNYYLPCEELDHELSVYKWETSIDILTGEEVTVSIPVDGVPDHILDALGYFVYSHSMRFSNKDSEEGEGEK